MKINECIHGFSVQKVRFLQELNAEFFEMTHEKTGLQLVWMNREEENKTFGIGFETLPWNDTGVFHILEHSVLCGSEKYPVKEPFVELMKNSMNTFLNAFTFPDKTVYPISSKNDKDFINLMRVYLDAVFCPSIYSKPEIFHQEGWHYEFDEKGNVSYKGVVFNEMKGAFANADELEETAMNKALFPDTPYKYVSGGDPASIPDLSYEEFISSHQKFYSPSNAYVFLDGRMDIEKVLEILDDEYLSHMEKGERIAPPAVQQPVDGGVRELEYELSEDEEAEGKTRIAWGTVLGSFKEREKLVAMSILADVLCGSNRALLSKSVLSAGLAEDVSLSVCEGIAQPWVRLEAYNLKDENRDKVEKLIFSELKKLAEDGIDKAQIEASMANCEFRMRERDYGSTPKGLVFGFSMLESWLYGGDPAQNLQVGGLFENLRKRAEEGYFEYLIDHYLLNNPHKAKVILVPSRTAGEERRKKEAARIEHETAGWNNEIREKLKKEQETLLCWQNSEDTKEQLASLPALKLSDISAEPENLPTEILDVDGIRVLYHDVNCAGIANFSLFFDADDLNEEEVSTLSFLTDILGKMRTSRYSGAEIDRKLRLLYGSIGFYVPSYGVKGCREKCRIKTAVSFGTLEKNVEEALSFAAELLTDTQFDEETVAYDLLKQLKTQSFQEIVMSGAGVGIGRVAAQYSVSGVVSECAGGFKYYKWLSNREKNFNWAELRKDLERLLRKIVCKNRLTLSLTGGSREILYKAVKILGGALPDEGVHMELQSVIRPWGRRKEGIVIPADISFACAGAPLPSFEGFNGNMNIASRILSLADLWNMIRVQGGAYGTGFSIRRDGLAISYSYRDPNAQRSLGVYEKMADFLEDFCRNAENLDGYIIGALSSAMPLLTPKTKGMRADSNYFSGLEQEDRRKTLLEMLHATPESVAAIAQGVRGVYEDCGVCVIGQKGQLDKCALETIEKL